MLGGKGYFKKKREREKEKKNWEVAHPNLKKIGK